MNRNFLRALIFLVLIAISALTLAVGGTAGPFRISLSTNPSVVPVGKAKIQVKVSDSQGKLVSNATVRVFARMSGMNMGERNELAIPNGSPGTYIAPATFAMAGQYDVTISIKSPSGSGQADLNISTGEMIASGEPSHSRWYFWLAGLIVLGFVILRMKATGQKVNVRALLNKTFLISVALLAITLGVSIWAVQSLRRPGAMTPVEAQGMKMDTPAPDGVLPVNVAEVKAEPFSATVSYSGQVTGFVEQDIVPRVGGTIIDMPVYVGDKVARGQLLARLDTSQIDPKVAESLSAVNNAHQGVSVAKAEYQQALSMVDQTKAETSMAATEVSEARSMLGAAKATKSATSSGVTAAIAERNSAQADLNAATADQTYQTQELERMRQLYAKGAVSKDEWQLAVSTSQKSKAAVSSARQRLAKSNAMVASAKSDLKRANFDVSSATSRVAKAIANRSAKLAQIETAQSGAHVAKDKIAQSLSAVSQAQAGLKEVETQKGYAELRADVDGVVTQRLVAPGVVVAPGQAVLTLAQVSPIRIQANVTQQDLAKIRVGDSVMVSDGSRGDNDVRLNVSSVSPSVDPASRMGVVEAIYANSDHRFVPGQFVSLKISIGAKRTALVIPSGALVTENVNGETVNEVWVVSTGASGNQTVSLRQIELEGVSSGEVAIKSGIKAGDLVVLSPFGLTDGMEVSAQSKPTLESSHSITIKLTADGYSPSEVPIPAGKPAQIVFIRTLQDTCATAVNFPSIGVHVETPLNKPVKVEIPAQSAGKQINFACPMNMYKGKVVVK